jgi:precorrin-3B synthase
LHVLRDGACALGVGLAFGQTDADALERLVDAARAAGATGFRTAPNRALLIVGVGRDEAGALAGAAETLGFVTRADDPRRAIVACPGAPLCASTELATRALAPAFADAASSLLDGSFVLHLSGCAKGCAHPGPAALILVGEDGRCGLIFDGAPRDQSLATTTAAGALAGVARLAQACAAERRPDETAAAFLSRLGPARVAAILAGPCHD